jgi:hypothetical protein
MMHNCVELYSPSRERVPETLSWADAPVPTGATLVLEMGEVISLRLSGRSFRIACVTGRLWATVDEDVEDSVLLPGEERTFRGRGAVVIQALGTATVRVNCNFE